jgi:hypothetical protein
MSLSSVLCPIRPGLAKWMMMMCYGMDVFSPCVTAIALIWLEVMAKNNEMSGFVSCRVTHGEQVGE